MRRIARAAVKNGGEKAALGGMRDALIDWPSSSAGCLPFAVPVGFGSRRSTDRYWVLVRKLSRQTSSPADKSVVFRDVIVYKSKLWLPNHARRYYSFQLEPN